MERKKVFLGMSGGVDSSVAAILLKEKGYDVTGVTMKLWENEQKENTTVSDSKKVCDILNIPHYVLDLREDFQKYVIEDFICRYKECKTPNPCIECNKHIKFGLMYKKAKELGMDYIATGHYATTEYSEEYKRYVIKKSKSAEKDQTYVLYNIPSEIIKQIIFPLGEFENKEEIRKVAKKYNLEVANKKDSQEICFIEDNDYINFLETKGNISKKEGNIVSTKGEILGTHQGLYRYTLGQRKGIQTKSNERLYVIELNEKNNELIVGKEEDLLSKELYAKQVNFILIDKLTSPMKVTAKIRYQAKETNATIYPLEKGTVKVEFDIPQKSATPGQSIVFYKDNYLLGGGKIEKISNSIINDVGVDVLGDPL